MLRIFKISFFLMISLLFVACGSLHIEKRLHRKGFYVQWNKPIKAQKDKFSEEEVLTNEHNVTLKKVPSTSDSVVSSESEISQSNGSIQSTREVTQDNHPEKNTNYIKRSVTVIKDRFIRPLKLKNNETQDSGNSGMSMVILGVLLVVLGIVLAFIMIPLNVNSFWIFSAIAFVSGITLAIIGTRKNKGKSTISGNTDSEAKINLFAILAWILLPLCLIWTITLYVAPLFLISLLIATIQIKANPEKYKGKQMVRILWILLLIAAIIIGVLLLFVFLA